MLVIRGVKHPGIRSGLVEKKGAITLKSGPVDQRYDDPSPFTIGRLQPADGDPLLPQEPGKVIRQA